MLTKTQAEWLDNNGFRLEGEPDPNTIPIFGGLEGDKSAFTPEHGCVGGAQRAKFIAQAPADLWLGGGAVVIYVQVKVGNESQDAVVGIPDRRHGGNLGPSAQGWAKYAEGGDLSLAALRELAEEI